MNNTSTVSGTLREPQLLGQTVVVIGGSSGIGLETARRARAEGADVVLTGRNAARLADIDFEQARRNPDTHLWLPLHVARNAVAKVRPAGTLLFMAVQVAAAHPLIPLSRALPTTSTAASTSSKLTPVWHCIRTPHNATSKGALK